ncbi:AAA family ATPase [Kroppenstedtia pulmonis]|uniref:AAA family ATPase n=1 Tax=Kroppenstedtia pulmonis TaxID=1380685 RepID=A0A7D3XP70_9BACL|nr:AAA family ATPase [Kroppenstedtia pulmonis]QKG83647.1 AAA family ATPase [Kroppenstedtia pulmonis]
MLGVLAEEDFVRDKIDKNAIFINKQNVIQFNIRIISQPPDSFPNERLITCYANVLEEKWGFEDPIHESDFFRIQELRNFLDNSLIVFRARKKGLPNQEFYTGTDIRLIQKSDYFQPHDTLISVPVFSKDEHGLSLDTFIARLIGREHVGRVDNISNEPNDTPPFILWKDNDRDYKVIGEFDRHHHANGGFLFYGKDLKMMDMSKEWRDRSYINHDNHRNIAFITIDTSTEISDALKVIEPFQADPEPESITSPAQPMLKTNNEPEIADEETQFMNDFIRLTREQGLLYDQQDLFNFHTAMKSSNLVVLAGMSGTGKSRLVQSYGRALGLDASQQIIIPVRPGWSDDTDLIGYADTLHMVYRPGDSGVINILRDANKEENQDKLYLVCFDEMNLSRVEHYFSQFLSVLEKEKNRELRLYNEDLTNRLYNSALYPPTITLGSNVLFVGTVNLDESTYHFSDKVLDRANVIRLNVMPFRMLKELDNEVESVRNRKRQEVIKPTRNKGISFSTYDKFRNKKQADHLSDRELDLLWEFHQSLQQTNSNMGIGPRILRQIGRYLNNIPASGPLLRQNALDLQLVQRIITKIRGPEDMLRTLLGRYDKETGEITNSRLLDLLDHYSDLSTFEKTRQAVAMKTRELDLNGYTL